MSGRTEADGGESHAVCRSRRIEMMLGWTVLCPPFDAQRVSALRLATTSLAFMLGEVPVLHWIISTMS